MNELDPGGLDCLVALADEGTFDRAAQRLALTQSAVSQRLRALESQAGRPLVVRSRPLQLTDAGMLLLRVARQWQILRTDAIRALGTPGAHGRAERDFQRLPIAVNADSLATWVLPALDALVQAGHAEGYGLELVVDDQDHTHEWLRQGAVMGCVSTLDRALQGCLVQPLGVMQYIAVASPPFAQHHLPQGLHAGNFPATPFLVFNRKDSMSTRWASIAFGVRGPRLRERHVPSAEAYLRAAVMGWGIGIVPALQAQDAIAAGMLVIVRPEIRLPVALYWHQWQLDSGGLLDRVGAALLAGATDALRA